MDGAPTGSPDLGASQPNDLSAASPDLAARGGAPDLGRSAIPDGGPFTPPAPADPVVTHAPPTPIAVTTLLPGVDVLDVSVDQGGGIWAVSSAKVYYFAPGRTTPFTYDQSSGLARGWTTWNDQWFDPGIRPVTFTSVAAGMPGEVMVGNIGAIADRLQVNPSTGAVERIDNLKVTSAQVSGSELPEHLIRVVAVWRVVVDLNGTLDGTAYLGGFHGFYAFHGLERDCGCLAFEEHQHYITDAAIGSADVKGLAISPDGDLWAGDRDFVSLLPQRSRGPNTGFFDTDFTIGLDVFPAVRDEVDGLAVDAAGGVYVASDGNGLAYLAPATHAPIYWSSATTLPQNHVRAVALDGAGRVWLGTASGGIARLDPQSSTWTYYTQASGLPSDTIRNIYFDKLTAAKKLYLATYNGLAIVTP